MKLKHEAVMWLLYHQDAWSWPDDDIAQALKRDGIYAQSTRVHDIQIQSIKRAVIDELGKPGAKPMDDTVIVNRTNVLSVCSALVRLASEVESTAKGSSRVDAYNAICQDMRQQVRELHRLLGLK